MTIIWVKLSKGKLLETAKKSFKVLLDLLKYLKRHLTWSMFRFRVVSTAKINSINWSGKRMIPQHWQWETFMIKFASKANQKTPK